MNSLREELNSIQEGKEQEIRLASALQDEKEKVSNLEKSVKTFEDEIARLHIIIATSGEKLKNNQNTIEEKDTIITKERSTIASLQVALDSLRDALRNIEGMQIISIQ